MRLVISVLLLVGLMLSSVELFAGEEDGERDGKCRPVMKRIMKKVREIFAERDKNGDGFIGPREWGKRLKLFRAIDRNNDGKISPRELAAFLLRRLKKHKEESQ
jgi:Ca2+-binding EF-hand superfamily protein